MTPLQSQFSTRGRALTACFAAIIALVTSLAVMTTSANAFGRPAPDYSAGYVTAHSLSGNGSLTAAVRPASRGGWEFRTPGGNWQDCEGDCEITLRNKVLDFWDNNATRSYPGRGLTLGVPY
ncbi:MAG: hypothetical protein AAFZ01_06950 [Pseudomonadota bacterium]